ncbi:MAG: arginine N-succinyltransferase [Gammaproteobacteria bacterium]|nr:arginine N-succinyltransferase [Gammaproteobacteria bacterium]
MIIIRPIREQDFSGLKNIAIDSGSGFTSLPVDDKRLEDKIHCSVQSTEQAFSTRGEQSYLFVLEDLTIGEIVGTTGIEATIGLSSPMFHYHVSQIVQCSKTFGVQKQHQVLTVCNDYNGVSEICTLYLNPKYRKTKAGRLLSKVRFMFMAQHPERFSDSVIAEMRGVADKDGNPPFWNWLQQHFFHLSFAQVDHLVGTGQKTFISELMPSYPVYVSSLPKEAQDVIGHVHENTKPALGLLRKEGFEYKGYVDLFDAGPTVEARLKNIKSIRESFVAHVEIVAASELSKNDGHSYAISNTSIKNFRATVSSEVIVHKTMITENSRISISHQLADALMVNKGDLLRVLAV